MSPKKHPLVKKILFPVSAILLFLFTVVQQSCKKSEVDVVENVANKINTTEKFFKLPGNANSALQRVAEELEKQNNNKEFIEEFIAKEGFAIWDKASLFVKADNANTTPNNSTAANLTDLSGLRDTTIFIPLVLNNANHVNAFIKAIVTDTVAMRLFRNSDYQNFPFQTPTPPTVTTAENYALRIMQMDKDVFGHTAFDIKDKRLFNNNTNYRDTGKITRGVDFTNATNNVTANGFTINSVLYFVCVTVTTTTTTVISNHCPYLPGQCPDYVTGVVGPCDNCAAVCANVNSSSSTSFECDTYYVEGGEGDGVGWPIIPTGGGSGGGGSQPPCPMGAIIINSAILPNCNPVPDAWPVLPPNVLQLRNILGLNTSMTNWLVQNPSVANKIYQSLLESLSDEDPTTGQAYMDFFSIEAVAASKITIAAAMNNYIEGSFNTQHYNHIKNFIPNSQNYVSIDPAFMLCLKLNCILLRIEHPDWSNTKIYWEAIKDVLHISLDVIGLFPIAGEIADLANGVIYTIEGDGVNATLSFAATIPIAGWGATATKFAKRAITALDGSTRTLKWIKQTNNIINFGDRGLLRKVLGLASGDARIAHHLIPWEQGVNDLVQKAASKDFHLNEILNGIPLTAIQHNGSHSLYNQKVASKLQQLWIAGGQSAMDAQTAQSIVRNLASDIRTWISNHPNETINNIIIP